MLFRRVMEFVTAFPEVCVVFVTLSVVVLGLVVVAVVCFVEL